MFPDDFQKSMEELLIENGDVVVVERNYYSTTGSDEPIPHFERIDVKSKLSEYSTLVKRSIDQPHSTMMNFEDEEAEESYENNIEGQAENEDDVEWEEELDLLSNDLFFRCLDTADEYILSRLTSHYNFIIEYMYPYYHYGFNLENEEDGNFELFPLSEREEIDSDHGLLDHKNQSVTFKVVKDWSYRNLLISICKRVKNLRDPSRISLKFRRIEKGDGLFFPCVKSDDFDKKLSDLGNEYKFSTTSSNKIYFVIMPFERDLMEEKICLRINLVDAQLRMSRDVLIQEREAKRKELELRAKLEQEQLLESQMYGQTTMVHHRRPHFTTPGHRIRTGDLLRHGGSTFFKQQQQLQQQQQPPSPRNWGNMYDDLDDLVTDDAITSSVGLDGGKRARLENRIEGMRYNSNSMDEDEEEDKNSSSQEEEGSDDEDINTSVGDSTSSQFLTKNQKKKQARRKLKRKIEEEEEEPTEEELEEIQRKKKEKADIGDFKAISPHIFLSFDSNCRVCDVIEKVKRFCGLEIDGNDSPHLILNQYWPKTGLCKPLEPTLLLRRKTVLFETLKHNCFVVRFFSVTIAPKLTTHQYYLLYSISTTPFILVSVLFFTKLGIHVKPKNMAYTLFTICVYQDIGFEDVLRQLKDLMGCSIDFLLKCQFAIIQNMDRPNFITQYFTRNVPTSTTQQHQPSSSSSSSSEMTKTKTEETNVSQGYPQPIKKKRRITPQLVSCSSSDQKKEEEKREKESENMTVGGKDETTIEKEEEDGEKERSVFDLPTQTQTILDQEFDEDEDDDGDFNPGVENENEKYGDYPQKEEGGNEEEEEEEDGAETEDDEEMTKQNNKKSTSIDQDLEVEKIMKEEEEETKEDPSTSKTTTTSLFTFWDVLVNLFPTITRPSLIHYSSSHKINFDALKPVLGLQLPSNYRCETPTSTSSQKNDHQSGELDRNESPAVGR